MLFFDIIDNSLNITIRLCSPVNRSCKEQTTIRSIKNKFAKSESKLMALHVRKRTTRLKRNCCLALTLQTTVLFLSNLC